MKQITTRTKFTVSINAAEYTGSIFSIVKRIVADFGPLPNVVDRATAKAGDDVVIHVPQLLNWAIEPGCEAGLSPWSEGAVQFGYIKWVSAGNA